MTPRHSYYQFTQRTPRITRCSFTSERIVSGDELKILGFYFGEKPTAARHVYHLKRKFWARAWILRHLKKADVSPKDLVKIYNCLVCPIFDYSAVIYHSLLNKRESKQLEDLQKKALRIVFGQKKTYEECLELAGMPTLYQRRTELVDKFLLTVIKNERYECWFPKKEFIHHDTRRKKIFAEKFARTDQFYMSPMYFFRRRLNEIALPEINNNND